MSDGNGKGRQLVAFNVYSKPPYMDASEKMHTLDVYVLTLPALPTRWDFYMTFSDPFNSGNMTFIYFFILFYFWPKGVLNKIQS